MVIEIRDPELLLRLQRLIASSGSSGPEDLLARLITTQEEQDRWLIEQRDESAAKIRRGLAQLDRGESIPDHEIAAYLDAHRQRS